MVPSLEDDEKSEAVSEDDADMDDERERSTTPPPSYLPLGPMLLHTQFHHALLLPLCQPLRPPGSAVAPMSLVLPPMPATAPTPVSPAASLEKINQELAAAGAVLRGRDEQVWPSDIQELADILKRVDVLDGPVELLTMFTSDGMPAAESVHLQRLDPPMFSAGKSGCVVQVLPSALALLEKLGLTPHGGKRDVVAFVFLEEGGLEKQRQAEIWLNKMSAGYSAKQTWFFHCRDQHNVLSRWGHAFEAGESEEGPFCNAWSQNSDLVFYIAIPDPAIGLTSPLLREIFSFVKQTQTKRSEAPILFQFVPEHLISSSESPSGEDSEIDALWDSPTRAKQSHISRNSPLFWPVPQALSTSRKQLQPGPLTSWIDIRSFHVGYRFSTCGKWLFAADIGSGCKSGIFTVQFAKRANVEWRIVIAKLGPMTVSELEGWNIHLSAAVPLCNDMPPFHVSLLSVEQNLCWPVIPHLNETAGSTSSRRVPAKDSKSIYVDTAAPAYAIYPSTRIPLSSRSCQEQADSPFIPDHDGTMTSDTSSILPISTSILVRSPPTRTTSTQSSTYIHLLHALHTPSAMLGFQEYPLLPFHLAALEAMHHSLRQEDIS
ncbi:hypothetical protein DFH29DRAFT_1046017 [Suillus ampliporus]|nr:hypothetical protein DFH29DRAFT_1046017 [Suillus ampliporus]